MFIKITNTSIMLKITFGVIINLLLISYSNGDDNFYCCPYYACRDTKSETEKNHTLCALEPCNFRESCKDTVTIIPFSKLEQLEILRWHNIFRNYIFGSHQIRWLHPLGGWRVKRFYRTENPEALSWDDELEFIAQCWANQCNKRRDPHCKRTTLFKYVDQNVFIINKEHYRGFEQVVGTWMSALKSRHQTYEKFGGHIKLTEVTRDFSNVASGYITNMGCGRTEWGRPERRVIGIFCNYGQATYKKNSRVNINVRYDIGKDCYLVNESLSIGESRGSLSCSANYKPHPIYHRLCIGTSFNNVTYYNKLRRPFPFRMTNDPYYWEKKAQGPIITSDEDSAASETSFNVNVSIFFMLYFLLGNK